MTRDGPRCPEFAVRTAERACRGARRRIPPAGVDAPPHAPGIRGAKFRSRPPAGAGGQFAVEFALVLMLALTLLFAPVAELIRLSMFDQALAQTTHRAARAAAADPGDCMAAIQGAFVATGLARWMLDLDGDGAVTVVARPAAGSTGTTPAPTPDVEVHVAAAGIHDETPWQNLPHPSCGSAGDLIRVHAEIDVEPWFVLFRFWDSVPRRAVSLARNQA